MQIDVLIITGLGLLILLTAWLPLALKTLPLSLPICCVGIGAALALLPSVGDAVPRPQAHMPLVEHITGLVVLLSLIGAGLKIDRRFGWRQWATTWRMLGVGMTVTVGVLSVLAVVLLGLDVPTALLLGAALAPTDPVLASDVQVGGPSKGDGDEVRFALTTEAGLNDGMAFPFVTLATIAAAGGLTSHSLAHWFAVDVLWKAISGAVLGVALGVALGWVTFHMPVRAKLLSKTGDGFVALGATFLAYGLIEIVHGYGFIGVFAAAMAMRASCPDSDYHERLHKFAEEIERLLMMVVLVGFGAAMVRGGLLSALTWPAAAFAILALTVVRPFAGWVATIGSGLPKADRGVISFFGIRGLATLFYIAYAFRRTEFGHQDLVWSVASLVILVSIVMHGILVTPTLVLLDRHREAEPPGGAEPAHP